jgi:hypothetical protein
MADQLFSDFPVSIGERLLSIVYFEVVVIEDLVI